VRHKQAGLRIDRGAGPSSRPARRNWIVPSCTRPRDRAAGWSARRCRGPTCAVRRVDRSESSRAQLGYDRRGAASGSFLLPPPILIQITLVSRTSRGNAGGWWTGRSSIGQTGSPLTRSKTDTRPCLVTCATALMRSRRRSMSIRLAPPACRSPKQPCRTSWWCHIFCRSPRRGKRGWSHHRGVRETMAAVLVVGRRVDAEDVAELHSIPRHRAQTWRCGSFQRLPLPRSLSRARRLWNGLKRPKQGGRWKQSKRAHRPAARPVMRHHT